MEPKNYLTVYMAVCRNSENDKWQPIGTLRDLISESVVPPHRGLVQFMTGFLRITQDDAEITLIKLWINAQESIHNPGYDTPCTLHNGRQFHVISARVTGDFIVTVD